MPVDRPDPAGDPDEPDQRRPPDGSRSPDGPEPSDAAALPLDRGPLRTPTCRQRSTISPANLDAVHRANRAQIEQVYAAYRESARDGVHHAAADDDADRDPWAEALRRLAGLEHMLKKADRLKEKIADVLLLESHLSPREALDKVPDAVRYTFTYRDFPERKR